MRTLFSLLGGVVLFGTLTAVVLAADTPEAAATRKLLDTKIKEVKYVDERIADVVDDLKEKVKGLKFRLDNKGGVSNNAKLSYTGKDKTVHEILDGLFTKPGFGYYVISGKNDAYNGLVLVKSNSKERGYKAGEEPKDKAPAKDK